MKTYYVKFFLDYKPICGCYKTGYDEDEAMLNAFFALICKYPNVEFNRMEAFEVFIED